MQASFDAENPRGEWRIDSPAQLHSVVVVFVVVTAVVIHGGGRGRYYRERHCRAAMVRRAAVVHQLPVEGSKHTSHSMDAD